jgi:hypothetical protein
MKLRRDHILTPEAILHMAAILALAVAALALYRTMGEPLGTAPLTSPPVKVVPATGSAGYNIEAFACDPATTVRVGFPPPGSTFVVTYNLDRRVDGVHEAVDVGVYPDGFAVGRHYDADNNPTDGNVTAKALQCIQEKAK